MFCVCGLVVGLSGSRRVSPLPPDWKRLRQVVLERDGFQCVFVVPEGYRCPNRATDVDHIEPGGADELWNLRSLCGLHHRRITSSQAGRRVHKRKSLAHPLRRQGEKHPGDPYQ